MTGYNWRDRLAAIDPCEYAMAWVASLPAETTYAEAWALCPRGDWMLWLVGRCEPVRSSAPWSDARRPLVLAAVDCARLALPSYEARYPGDGRVRACLDVTAAWARGEATREEVLAARRAAAAAYADAYVAAAAAAAAYAAADAAYAAAAAAAAYADAAYAPYAAADAAYAAAAAAYADAAYAAERTRVHRECADIVRARFPSPPELP